MPPPQKPTLIDQTSRGLLRTKTAFVRPQFSWHNDQGGKLRHYHFTTSWLIFYEENYKKYKEFPDWKTVLLGNQAALIT